MMDTIYRVLYLGLVSLWCFNGKLAFAQDVKDWKIGPAQPSAVATSEVLVTTIASIPVANRPIAMALRSEWDSVTMGMNFFPYVLFANGTAIEADCAKWQPQAATPSSGCKAVAWKRVGSGSIRFGTDDPIETGGFFGFKPGQKVSYTVSRTGGAGVAGAASTFGGTVLMTNAGQIRVGSWSGVSVGGGNYSGFSSRQGGLSGRYYLDGFLIAIADDRGGVSVGFIGAKQEGKTDFLYVNGKQYWTD
jgi:hypothetical protein